MNKNNKIIGSKLPPIMSLDEQKEKGNEHFRKKEFDKAIEIYRSILSKNVSDFYQIAILNYNISSCFYQKTDYTQALDYAILATNSYPGYEKAILRKALCYERMEKYEDAIQCFSCLFDQEYQKEAKSRIKELVKKLDNSDWFTFQVLMENDEVEFEVEIPYVIVKKYLSSIVNETSKNMSDKLTFSLRSDELEYPISERNVKIMFKQIFEKKFSATISDIPPLLALAAFFNLNLLVTQCIEALIENNAVDHLNSVFFYNWSVKYIEENEIYRSWNNLYNESIKKTFEGLKSNLQNEIYLESIPKELLTIILKDYFNDLYPLILINKAQYLEDILLKNVETFKFIIDDQEYFIPIEYVKDFCENKLNLDFIYKKELKFYTKDLNLDVVDFDIKRIYAFRILEVNQIPYEEMTFQDTINIYSYYHLIKENYTSYGEKIRDTLNKLLIVEIENTKGDYFKSRKKFVLNAPLQNYDVINQKLKSDYQDINDLINYPESFIRQRVSSSEVLQESLFREWRRLTKK